MPSSADSWIITDSKKLPPAVGPVSGLGNRVLVCIGQTVDNPTFQKPLAEASGILAVLPVNAIADPSSPLQGFMSLLDRLGLKLADLKNPRGIDLARTHGNMAVIEHFEGAYRTTMMEKSGPFSEFLSAQTLKVLPTLGKLIGYLVTKGMKFHAGDECMGCMGCYHWCPRNALRMWLSAVSPLSVRQGEKFGQG